MPLSFWLDHFLDSRAEIYQIFAFFFWKLKTPKSNSEINWPRYLLHGNIYSFNKEKEVKSRILRVIETYWALTLVKKLTRWKRNALHTTIYSLKFIQIPSLNTQSCIKGLLVVRDFCFWALWAAGPALKRKIWADYEQLLRVGFSCFYGQNLRIYFLKNIVASTLKSCIIPF